MVRSQIIKASGEPVKVDYMMRRNGDGWLISDIYLDGAIREVATRRSEFAAILRSDGIDGLVAALNRKADNLTERRLKRSTREVYGGHRTESGRLCRHAAGHQRSPCQVLHDPSKQSSTNATYGRPCCV
jgi:hypothetical protein